MASFSLFLLLWTQSIDWFTYLIWGWFSYVCWGWLVSTKLTGTLSSFLRVVCCSVDQLGKKHATKRTVIARGRGSENILPDFISSSFWFPPHKAKHYRSGCNLRLFCLCFPLLSVCVHIETEAWWFVVWGVLFPGKCFSQKQSMRREDDFHLWLSLLFFLLQQSKFPPVFQATISSVTSEWRLP